MTTSVVSEAYGIMTHFERDGTRFVNNIGDGRTRLFVNFGAYFDSRIGH